MSERFRENEKNSPYRRGMVKEVKGGRIKVNFGDEDDNTSFWMSANQRGTGANKSWSMPNVGEQVNCLVDWDGEDGCVLGAVWNAEDKAPTSDNDLEHTVYASGLEVTVSRSSGNMTIKNAKNVVVEAKTITAKADSFTVEADSIKLKGNVEIEGDSLTHNGANVGDTHLHTKVTPGPANTGIPA
ncbi:phage baseplate assembly protein V [Flexibacterium corallicola]|uniref:phage baseplate assembly protein V n=1 Tax=Flexibacterium corallicola TaxID=3037259 RepID=UPI00286F640A|nr:phage baseplate assembly protein V [Pseudovibrio sp. M1P-2-3]